MALMRKNELKLTKIVVSLCSVYFINPATNYVIPAAAERRAGIQQTP
ncbi:hypothetical protein D1AOALGA4SA_5150 [Olavius algarvensis Delta 1 endosymbiont]|nr:hypothetical protein D1AOALGA4SA_5150 [Olavius algarvensis Delta 1 endosymbiont]